MNLRELARKDALCIFECEQAGNTDCVLSDGNSVWEIPMLLCDVGYEVDTDGNKVAGRSVWASYVSERVQSSNGCVLTPKKGWTLNWLDDFGRDQAMFVSFCEVDRSLGVTKLHLLARLSQ